MKDKCGTCAYREGTEANKTESTRLMAELCVMSGEVFTCHEDFTPCRGWAQAVQVESAHPEWRKRVAAEMADAFHDILDKASRGIETSEDNFWRDLRSRFDSVQATAPDGGR